MNDIFLRSMFLVLFCGLLFRFVVKDTKIQDLPGKIHHHSTLIRWYEYAWVHNSSSKQQLVDIQRGAAGVAEAGFCGVIATGKVRRYAPPRDRVIDCFDFKPPVYELTTGWVVRWGYNINRQASTLFTVIVAPE